MPIAQLRTNLGEMAIEIEDGEDFIRIKQKSIDQKKMQYKLLKSQITGLEALPKIGYQITKIKSDGEKNADTIINKEHP